MLLANLLVVLFGLAHAVTDANFDPVDRWAWSTNAGWINFGPSCTGCEGVWVYADYLAGHAWAENLGWVPASPATQMIVSTVV